MIDPNRTTSLVPVMLFAGLMAMASFLEARGHIPGEAAVAAMPITILLSTALHTAMQHRKTAPMFRRAEAWIGDLVL